MGSLSGSTSFDVEDVLSKLTLSEKIALLSGVDFWHTAPVHRLGVPSIRLSDGPNGVRGTRYWNSVPAACLPCGTALAATWDTDLIKRGGVLQGQEAIAKGVSVLLGPTTNMQRSPLGGRGFESFSEDPYLAGAMSAASINGIQSTGVAATIKHFVCNDQEHQRQSVNSIVTERALRETYLMPFMIAQRDAKPACFMTSYNKVNGTHVSEDYRLIHDILRGEWGFDGLVMSDWFGTYSADKSVKAGLDLEMPGPSYARGKLINQELGCGKLIEADIDERARQVLKLVKNAEPLGIAEGADETTIDTPETAALLREIASSGIVLLKNEHNLLPFRKDRTTAVIGPNAAFAAYSGGGSASLAPYYAVSPLEGLRAQCPDIMYALGCPGWKSLPLMSLLTQTQDHHQGLTLSFFLEPPTVLTRRPIDTAYINNSNVLLMDYKHPLLKTPLYWLELRGTFTPSETAEYEFGLTCAGTGKIFVNDECIVDNETTQQLGDSFFGAGTVEEIGVLHLEKDTTYDIRIPLGTYPTMTLIKPGVSDVGAGGFRVGLSKRIDRAAELKQAVRLAQQVDQVVLCVGLNQEWESEGWDRENMDLPPGTVDLIEAVSSVTPNVAVVIQSGTPVTIQPWVNRVSSVIQAWYGGNETGNAIADVIFGKVCPSGKLPLSFPLRTEDNPAYLNFRSDKNRVLYGEDMYIGYRYYEKTRRDVAFAFGHGLSYTTFKLSHLRVLESDSHVQISIAVTNTGPMAGAQVVQVYVRQQKSSINRPLKELKAFQKLFLEPGETRAADMKMSKKEAASFWDESRNSWVMEKGSYDILVGDSSASTPFLAQFDVGQSSWWRGL